MDILKKSLKEELNIAMAIALTLNSSMEIKKANIQEMVTTIKKANMFNHHLVSYPLINYTISADEKDFSLIETSIDKLTEKDLLLDPKKIKYSPRFIHFEDINIFNFIKKYKDGGNLFLDKFNDIFTEFENINSITTKYKIGNHYDKSTNTETIEYRLTTGVNKTNIGIASVPLSEERCFEVLNNPNISLTAENKQKMFALLKTAEENDANIVVLPEFYLPIAWLGEVSSFAKRTNMTVVSGLQYIKVGNRVYNFIVNLQPFYTDLVKYRNIFTHIREKYDYSPIEEAELKKLGYYVVNSACDIITIYNLSNQFSYCNRVCYEFTNITSRARLKNKVELIVVPEFNKDTNYFSNIVESTARDDLCFIVQANTSIYGDSRITAPYNTDNKNILLVKGGKNDIMIVGAVDIIPLVKYKKAILERKSCDDANAIAKASSKFKKPPARFF